MMFTALLIALLPAAEPTLPRHDAAEGWVKLFDGETTDGWTVDGDVRVLNGNLVFGGSKATIVRLDLIEGEFSWEFLHESGLSARWKVPGPAGNTEPWSISFGFGGASSKAGVWNEQIISMVRTGTSTVVRTTVTGGTTLPRPGMRDRVDLSLGTGPATATVTVPAGQTLTVRNVRFKPSGLQSIFNGNDLTGWKTFPGEKYKSKFSITPEGWINVKDGPGDLQTENKYCDFLFQGECISHGTHLNSGIFFRCLPDQYQQGYEVQIRNQFDEKTGKPVDFGTGAIYRRKEARRVVSKDGSWFTLTLLARGNRFTTWVDGYMTVDWLDDRKPNDNARQGFRAGPGHLSIQGHDPTTNLSFRNLRIVEVK